MPVFLTDEAASDLLTVLRKHAPAKSLLIEELVVAIEKSRQWGKHIIQVPHESEFVLTQPTDLRDYFAGQALTGPAFEDRDFSPEYVAQWSYKYADAMLVEREKKK